jgi:hypothetical protein
VILVSLIECAGKAARFCCVVGADDMFAVRGPQGPGMVVEFCNTALSRWTESECEARDRRRKDAVVDGGRWCPKIPELGRMAVEKLRS